MSEEHLVVVYNAMNEIQAMLYRTMLEEAGIAVVERPREYSWLEGVKEEGLHSELMVRSDDADRAMQLVQSFSEEAEEGLLTPDDTQEGASDTPPTE